MIAGPLGAFQIIPPDAALYALIVLGCWGWLFA
jgi:hypothetical protein